MLKKSVHARTAGFGALQPRCRRNGRGSAGRTAPIIVFLEPTPLALDTSAAVESQQIAAWRRMSPREKAVLVTALTRTAYEMAWAGVRHRHPDASPREHFLRVAVIVLGPDLAKAAYPDAARVAGE